MIGAGADGVSAFYRHIRHRLGPGLCLALLTILAAACGVTATPEPGVTVAAAASANCEVRDVFTTFMQKWTDFTAATIDAERKRGAAPITLPSHDLAAALNLMNERALQAAFAAETPGVPEDRVLDTLVHVWISSIYGQSG